MVQATKTRQGAIDHAVAASDDELFRALAVLIQRLKRLRGSDPDHGARTFLLAHVDRLGPVRMSDLATTACLDQSTVSRHLRQLEDQGLVTRSPDPDDRRATLLELSDSGRDVLERAVAARSQLIAEATAEWSLEDREHLTRLLTRLAHDLEPIA
jgi:DNA-binding MarR family transcriptional regulator